MSDDQHFDTFETDFFQQGDDSASLLGEAERFEDLEDSGKRRRALFSRQTLLIAGASMAVLGCAALWRSNSHSSAPAVVASTEAAPSAVLTPKPPRTEPPLAQPAFAAQPAPVPPAAPVPQPARVPQSAPLPQPAPVPPAAPVPQEAPMAQAALVTPLPPDDTQARCQLAIRGKRSKDILAVCPAAVSDDPIAADIAVALARIEFDRGRSAQASAWSKKAIAANPETADAYVFLGGAEQSAGHGKAAKQAYQQYLRLAPAGRYAADLRAIVNSL